LGHSDDTVLPPYYGISPFRFSSPGPLGLKLVIR
jgi:hypothetical protein